MVQWKKDGKVLMGNKGSDNNPNDKCRTKEDKQIRSKVNKRQKAE